MTTLNINNVAGMRRDYPAWNTRAAKNNCCGASELSRPGKAVRSRTRSSPKRLASIATRRLPRPTVAWAAEGWAERAPSGHLYQTSLETAHPPVVRQH